MTLPLLQARPPRGPRRDPFIERDAGALVLVREDAAHFPGGHAAGLAHVETEAQIAALCAAGLALLPIGAQSSLTGGATPRGDIVVPLQRFKALQVGDGWVRAGAGVTLDELDAALAPHGVWYPPVPTYTAATVGGIVATNAAGPATFRHGVTRDWVQALTVVLASGDVLDLERGQVTVSGDDWFIDTSRGRVRVSVPSYPWPRLRKCSAGYYAARPYDPLDLFIGAEGTLGIVTEVTLRTVPRPPARFDALVACPSIGAATALVASLERASARRDIDLASVEYIDARSLALLHENGDLGTHEVAVAPDTDALLFLEIELPDSPGDATLWRAVETAADPEAPGAPRSVRAVRTLCRLFTDHDVEGGAELVFPGQGRRRGQLVALREAVPSAVNQRVAAAHAIDSAVSKLAGDFIVPGDRVADLVDACRREFTTRGLDGAIWGHISDGNLHPNVLPTSRADTEAGRDALLAVGRHVLAWGGSPLAEHGVGRNPLKQAFLEMLHGTKGVAEMRAIKHALDPHDRLSRGVLLARVDQDSR